MNVTQNQKQPNKKRSFSRTVVVPVVSTIVLSAVTLLYGNRVYDFVAARLAKPSTEVVAIHDAIGMTAEGSDVFYASNPSVETGAQFNESCSSSERTAAILGCYYKRTIYIYNVTNAELAKAEDVTAAHEMLHAAYERLNFIDKSHVDAMIKVEYAKQKNNTELRALMKYYEQTEPDALTNELHSILGTTVASLSPDLEAYYGRYFTNRSKIVAMNTTYTSVFSSIENQSNQLSAKIDAMKPQIEADLASYNNQLSQLDTDIATFNTRAATGYYTTQAAFNADRSVLANRVEALNALRSDINARVNEYNGYIAELKKLSVRVGELNSSINGISTPEASL